MKPAVLYARKSKGKDIASQVYACEKYAKEHGYVIVDKYVDEDASRVGFKNREDYQRLLEDIRSGKLDGYVVLVRDQDRLTGEPAEQFEWNMTTLVAKVRTFDCTSGRAIQDDYYTDMEAAKAKEEVRQTSKRWRGRWAQRDAEGTPPYSPIRPFGYTQRYAEVVPEERDWLLKIRDKILAGVKLSAICNWLNKEGVVTTAGGPFKQSTLSKMVRRWEYAGWRRGRDGNKLARGKWEAIWSEDDHERILAKLDGNEPFSDNNARKHLLSGIAACGNCGSKLRVSVPKKKYAVYRCQEPMCGHKVSIGLEDLERYAVDRVYEELKNFPEFSVEEDDTTDDEIAALRDERAETVAARKDRKLTLADFAELVGDIDAKIKELLKQKDRATRLLVDDAEEFLKADIDSQRAVIKRLYPVIGVKAARHKGAPFTPGRLEFP